jgi:TetR/AcrR family transcriptional regulator, transcriptional repressor for nem operon
MFPISTMRMPASSAVRRGRPREFDMDLALKRAAHVFRERGYHATSIADLTTAMQLASGSVYKAFEDKQAIYAAVFEQESLAGREKLRTLIDTAVTGRERVRAVLAFYAGLSSGTEGKRGCIVVGGAAGLSTLESGLAQRVVAVLRASEKLIADLIRQGHADGYIPSAVEGAATARLMLCLLQGMRVAGKTGRSRKEMMEVVDAAMKLLS